MLQKSAQRKLALYFLGMIALHIFLVTHAWKSVRIGMPDFTIFYTAGRILHDGQGLYLYDDHVQQSFERSLTPMGLQKRGSILPYNHPPFEVLLFLPLARFSYLTAYFIWLALNLGLLLSIPLLLRRYFPILGKAPFVLWILAMLSFFPIFMALLQGQDSILLLFCYCCAYVAMREGNDWRLGSWLGLGLFKFHLILPFVFAYAWLWRRRVVAAFIAVAAALILLGVGVSGMQGVLRYPRFVWESEHNKTYLWNGGFHNTANLHGLIGVLLPAGLYWMFRYLLAAASVLTLLAACLVWRRVRLRDQPTQAVAFAVTLIATVLASYHTFVYDWSILFLAILLVCESVLSNDASLLRIRRPVGLAVALLLFSPAYTVLILRYQRMEFMALVLVVLFLSLLAGIWRPDPAGSEHRGTLAAGFTRIGQEG